MTVTHKLHTHKQSRGSCTYTAAPTSSRAPHNTRPHVRTFPPILGQEFWVRLATGSEVRLGRAGGLSRLNTWHPGTGEAAETRRVWSLGVGRRGLGEWMEAGAEAKRKREWSASPRHEAG